MSDKFSFSVFLHVNSLCMVSNFFSFSSSVGSISVAKFLFGISDSSNGLDDRSQEKLQDVTNLLRLLDDSITMNEHLFSQNEKTSLYQVVDPPLHL